MTRRVLVFCDRCGKECMHSWLTMVINEEYDTGALPMKVGPLDFCSDNCMNGFWKENKYGARAWVRMVRKVDSG